MSAQPAVTPLPDPAAPDPAPLPPADERAVPWIAVWVMLAGLVAATPLWMHWWEPGMFLAINRWGAAWPSLWWVLWSDLGNAWMVLALSAPLMALAPRLLWGWVCAAPFAMALARLGKDLIVSPRPAAVVDNAQMRVVGEFLHNVSMPSGHTLTAFAVVGGVYFALPVLRRWRWAWLWLLAGMTGLARIAVGAHWPGDVAVGACLGIGAAILGKQLLLQRMGAAWMSPTHWGVKLIALLQLVGIYVLVTDEIDFPENAPVEWVLAVWAMAWLVYYARVLWRCRWAHAGRATGPATGPG